MLTLTCCQDHILTEIYGLYGLKLHIVEKRRDVTMRDDDDDEELKIELPSQWKLEAESRNFMNILKCQSTIVLFEAKVQSQKNETWRLSENTKNF